MRASGVAFLWIDRDQMHSGGHGVEVRVQVFFSDKKDKPARSERCVRSVETGGPDAADVPDCGEEPVATIGRKIVLLASGRGGRVSEVRRRNSRVLNHWRQVVTVRDMAHVTTRSHLLSLSSIARE